MRFKTDKRINEVNSTKKVVLTGLFISIASMLAWMQIPVPFLSPFLTIELSLIAILIARRYIGLGYTLIVSVVAPWATMTTFWAASDPIGVIILIFVNVIVVLFDWLFTRDNTNVKVTYPMAFIVLIISTIVIVVFNLLLFTPLYYKFDWDTLFSDGLWKYITYWFSLYFPFNLFKLGIITIIYPLVIQNLKKVI